MPLKSPYAPYNTTQLTGALAVRGQILFTNNNYFNWNGGKGLLKTIFECSPFVFINAILIYRFKIRIKW